MGDEELECKAIAEHQTIFIACKKGYCAFDKAVKVIIYCFRVFSEQIKNNNKKEIVINE
jgi:hypothetical protein